jgi:hypothetical protein
LVILLCFFLGQSFVLTDSGKLQASVVCVDPLRVGEGRSARFVGCRTRKLGERERGIVVVVG